MRKTLFSLAIMAAIAVTATPAAAQTVTNPTTVEFTVDLASHNGIDTTRYELRFYLSGATSPFTFADIGKPTATATGLITVTRPEVFAPIPPGLNYFARVAAIGPSGEAVSENSNSFNKAGMPIAPTAPALR